MNTEIPHLKIERLSNGCIRLENEAVGDGYIVDIHPIHLRYMAEKLGLVREMSASEADALRMVGTLRRRLLKLKDRIDHLGSYLCLHSDSAHADLSYEQDYATATADICDEFCADLEDLPLAAQGGDGAGNAASVTPALASHKTPENGVVQQPQKRGSSAASKPSGNPDGTQRVSPPAQHSLLKDQA